MKFYVSESIKQLPFICDISWLLTCSECISNDDFYVTTPENNNELNIGECIKIHIITHPLMNIDNHDTTHRIHLIHKRESMNEYADVLCEVYGMYYIFHSFGDSHTILTHKIPGCWCHWLGFNTNLPTTMYRIGNEGLDLNSAVKMLGNGHELHDVKPGEVVLYSYGEIDVRYHIMRNINEGQDYKLVINELVRKYIQVILNNQDAFKCKSFVYLVLPPSQRVDGDEKMVRNTTIENRVMLTDEMNKQLIELCNKYKIPTIDLRHYVTNENGTMNLDYCDASCHIKTDYYHWIRDAIMNGIVVNY